MSAALGGGAPETARPYAVLIVDDSPFRGQLARRLRAAGVVTAEASGPEKARLYLRHLRFDAVLVDLDGEPAPVRRLLDEIRRAQPGARPIGITQRGAQLAGLRTLRKPFGVEAILGLAA
ncbi:MAG TPA: hypothetical protein VFR85_17340 [Anaeromyxobacteraceae bacterium]|nr:hypothetical protein [Anaeromyxobacteraceae bacterium]